MAIQRLSEPLEPADRHLALAELEMTDLLIGRAGHLSQFDQGEPLGLPKLSEPIIHAIDRRKPTRVEQKRLVFAQR